MEHTKGPWNYSGAGSTVYDAFEHRLATAWGEHTTFDEDRANARLMAAAPEMLKALEVARGCLVKELQSGTTWPFQTDEDCKEHFAIKQIDAAIAKATE